MSGEKGNLLERGFAAGANPKSLRGMEKKKRKKKKKKNGSVKGFVQGGFGL